MERPVGDERIRPPGEERARKLAISPREAMLFSPPWRVEAGLELVWLWVTVMTMCFDGQQKGQRMVFQWLLGDFLQSSIWWNLRFSQYFLHPYHVQEMF